MINNYVMIKEGIILCRWIENLNMSLNIIYIFKIIKLVNFIK